MDFQQSKEMIWESILKSSLEKFVPIMKSFEGKKLSRPGSKCSTLGLKNRSQSVSKISFRRKKNPQKPQNSHTNEKANAKTKQKTKLKTKEEGKVALPISNNKIKSIRSFFNAALSFIACGRIDEFFQAELSFAIETFRYLELSDRDEQDRIENCLLRLQNISSTLEFPVDLKNTLLDLAGKPSSLYLPFAESQFFENLSGLTSKTLAQAIKIGISTEISLALFTLLAAVDPVFHVKGNQVDFKTRDQCKPLLTNPGAIIKTIKKTTQAIRRGSINSFTIKKAQKFMSRARDSDCQIGMFIDEVCRLHDLYRSLKRRTKPKRDTSRMQISVLSSMELLNSIPRVNTQESDYQVNSTMNDENYAQKRQTSLEDVEVFKKRIQEQLRENRNSSYKTLERRESSESTRIRSETKECSHLERRHSRTPIELAIRRKAGSQCKL